MARLPNDLVTTVVASVRTLTETVRAYELVQPEGWDLPRFHAGAHVDVHIPGGFVRQYSIASDPAETHRYTIAVARRTGGAGGSQAMHASVNAGDWLSVSLPRNHFALDEGAARHVFIAGGIGITPFLSMAASLRRRDVPFELHMCSPNEARTPFLDELRAMRGGSIRLYGRTPEGPTRLNVAHVLAGLGTGDHVYCCGPKDLMDAVRTAAQTMIEPGHVHFERFEKPEPTSTIDRPAYSLGLARRELRVAVSGGETMLAAILRSGVDLDYGCEAGTCGRCRTRYLSGSVDHRDFCLSDTERRSYMMPCVSVAACELLTVDL